MVIWNESSRSILILNRKKQIFQFPSKSDLFGLSDLILRISIMRTDSWNFHLEIIFKWRGLCVTKPDRYTNLWWKHHFWNTNFCLAWYADSEMQIQWGLNSVLWLGAMHGCRILSMHVPPQNLNIIWCLNDRYWSSWRAVNCPVNTLLSLIDLMETGVCIWQCSDIANDQNCFSKNLSNPNGKVLSKEKFS